MKPVNVPHSWELDSWPDIVWPNEKARARWISRAYRKELIAAGALTRVGKTLVFMGPQYTRWLERRARHVVEYVSNNRAIGKASTTGVKRGRRSVDQGASGP